MFLFIFLMTLESLSQIFIALVICQLCVLNVALFSVLQMVTFIKYDHDIVFIEKHKTDQVECDKSSYHNVNIVHLTKCSIFIVQ